LRALSRTEIVGISVCFLLAATIATAAPSIQVTHRQIAMLEIHPMSATPAPEDDAPPYLIEVDPEHGGQTSFLLAWPDDESRVEVRFSARAEPTPSERHHLFLEATLTLPGGREVHSQRSLWFDDRTTSLFEIYRDGDRPLTLAIEATSEEQTIFTGKSGAGDPVVLTLEIERVVDGTATLVETNHLRTLTGEPVFYSFSLGSGEADSVRIELNPTRILETVAEIEIDVTGRLPGKDGLQLVSRRERLLISRGTTSTVAVESGDPPTGYRFLVTPRY
jgi:hypothetical protein